MNQTRPNSSSYETDLPPEYTGLARPKPSVILSVSNQDIYIGLALITIGIIFLTVALINIIEYKRLSKVGVYTRATITRLDKSQFTEKPICTVDYTFNGPSKNGGTSIKFQGSENISCSLYSDLKVGKTIGINYDASDPKTSKIKGNIWSQTTYFIIGVGAILFGLSPGTGLKSRRNKQQLSEEGQQTQAGRI